MRQAEASIAPEKGVVDVIRLFHVSEVTHYRRR